MSVAGLRSLLAFLDLLPARLLPLVMAVGREDTDCAYLVTVETPSTNLVLKRTFALLNMPSLRDTTINCTKTRKKKYIILSLG